MKSFSKHTFRWQWAAAVLVLAGLFVLLRWWQWTRRERSQDKVILAAARRYSVDPALVKAVVWRESRFDPLARGGKGEVGLMQIMEPTAKEWAAAQKLTLFYHHQLFEPGKNTDAGTWYLAKLLRRYPHTDNPVPYALADYNAGRGNVLRWMQGAATTNSEAFISQITFPSTRDYIRTVTLRRERYRDEFQPQQHSQ